METKDRMTIGFRSENHSARVSQFARSDSAARAKMPRGASQRAIQRTAVSLSGSSGASQNAQPGGTTKSGMAAATSRKNGLNQTTGQRSSDILSRARSSSPNRASVSSVKMSSINNPTTKSTETQLRSVLAAAASRSPVPFGAR